MVFANTSQEQQVQTLAAFDSLRRTIFYPKTDVAQHAATCAVLKQNLQSDLERYRQIAIDVCVAKWGAKPVAIEPIGSGGTYHLLYKVEQFPEETYIIRLNRLPQQCVAWEFMIDAWVYSTLQSLGLPTARCIDIDCSRLNCATDYEVLTCVVGATLSVYEDAVSQHMDPLLLQAVGNYVARVHNVKLAGAGPLSIQSLYALSRPEGIHASWLDYVMLRLPEHIDVCVSIGAIDQHEAAAIERIFDTYANVFKSAPTVLLHGDLGNHNFISADGQEIAALIDWEDCMSGDPVFDIAFWGTFFRDYMLDDFLAGYKQTKQLAHDFHLRYWLYYLRIALSKTVHRYYFGYKDHPGRLPASQRIQKALGKLQAI
jgi:fructosamine-3-kinase